MEVPVAIPPVLVVLATPGNTAKSRSAKNRAKMGADVSDPTDVLASTDTPVDTAKSTTERGLVFAASKMTSNARDNWKAWFVRSNFVARQSAGLGVTRAKNALRSCHANRVF